MNPGDDSSASHLANGAQWYFGEGGGGDDPGSWGFAAAGDSVSRYPCDTSNVNSEQRLCWHTEITMAGYRCGATKDLNAGADWSKIVYRSSTSLFADGFDATGDVCAWAAREGADAD